MRLLAVLAIVGFVAVPAMAERSDLPIYTATTDAGAGLRTTTNYSNMDFTVAWAASSGTLGGVVAVDDYDGVETLGTNWLTEFKFAGGATGAGGNGVVFFTFFDTTGAYVGGFGSQLPDPGNWIWTVTINTPFLVPADGYCQMWANNGVVGGGAYPITEGRWFGSIDAPTIGTTGSAVPNLNSPTTGYHLDMKCEITFVPEPTTLALLGMGALALIRRR
ncbi:MAG: PEP-CTERM sorting domain-containing protein [bacterium]|nr:PEP-CTERM sorting domain-containing protein [bacterium]